LATESTILAEQGRRINQLLKKKIGVIRTFKYTTTTSSPDTVTANIIDI